MKPGVCPLEAGLRRALAARGLALGSLYLRPSLAGPGSALTVTAHAVGAERPISETFAFSGPIGVFCEEVAALLDQGLSARRAAEAARERGRRARAAGAGDPADPPADHPDAPVSDPARPAPYAPRRSLG